MMTSGMPAATSRSPSLETPKPIVAIVHIAEGQEADAFHEALPKLFAEVRHQMSSPSFLICS